MATLDNKGTKLTGSITLTKKSGTTLTLSTDDKYVDKDIEFTLGVQSGTGVANTASADANVVSGSSAGDIGASIGTKTSAQPASGYFIRVDASGSGSSKVTTAGWLDTGALPAASTTATSYFPVTGATVTQNAPTINTSTGVVSATSTTTAGYTPAQTTAANTLALSTQAAKTVTPTESEQTAVSAGKYTTGNVKVGAISSTYVGSAIPQNDSDDLSVDGATVTAPAGYYATSASKTIGSGTVSASVSSNTSGSASMSATGFTPLASGTSAFYVTLSTTAGKVKAKAQGATAGYITTSTSNETAETSVSVSGNGNKIYIPAGSVTQNAPTIDTTTGVVSATSSMTAGYINAGTSASNSLSLSTQAGKTVTPTESTQTAVSAGKYTLGAVKVGAISSTYVGSGITRNNSENLTVEGATITAPAGYYAEDASASVASGSVTQNAPTVNTSTGVVTATSTVTAGYVSAGTKSNTLSLSTQAGKTVTPSESEQTAVAANKYTLGAVKVGAISSTYVGSEVPRNDSDDLTVNGATVSVPSGYYADDASATIANGSVAVNAPTVNSSGLVTATATVGAGYVSASTPSNTLQLTTQGAQTITPGTSNQTIAAGKYLTGAQTIKGDADLTAANIKKGVEIFGVTGTFTTTPSGKSALTAAALRSGYAGFINGSQVNGSMPDTTVTEGVTTVSSDTATRGEWSQTAGYTGARTIAAATFNNEATSGTTYVDISETTSAPVLAAGDYLYINKGYTDNLKISLAKLVPDGSDVKGHGDYLLSGHSAYDNDGALVAGTITTLAASDISVSGRTITIPTQKYTGASGATAVTKSIGVGTVTSGTANITSLTKTYNSTSGKFDITGSADVSAPSVGTAGYISSSEGTRNKKTGGATVTATIDKIVATTALSGTTTKKPSITKQATPTGVTNAASGDATTTAPSSGVYVAVKSAANTGTITATPTVSTAGYGDATNNGITGASATVGASASDTTYVPITTTSASVSGKTVSYGTGWITGGSKSVAVGTITSGAATIDSASYAYNSTNGNFDVTGSASIGAPTVGTAGYVSSTEGTKNGNTATLSTTVDKIAGTTALSGVTSARKPSIAKQAISITGVTDAASGDAVTTAPSSGVYVAVKSAANTGTITATPSITTAGYGDATNHGITGDSTTVGAAASDTTYVPITTTSASVSGKTVSYGSGWITAGSKSVADGAYSASVNAHSVTTTPVVTGSTTGTVTNIGTTTKPSGTDGTDYWTITPSGSVTTTGKSTASGKATIGTAGYLATGNKTSSNSVIDITPSVSAGSARYLAKASTSTSNGTATATGGTASTSVTGMVTSETDTGYSVSASATGGNASVTASSATVGVGYNPSAVTASTSAKSATGTSASQTKYIQKGVLSASVSSNTGGSASMAATGFTPLSSGTSSYYVTLSTSAGSVKAKAAVGTEGYVKSETNETGATSVAVSGNGTKMYIPAGAYAGSVSSHSISTTPVVTGATSGTITNIGTTTKPSSGTDGTDYWTITPGGSVTTTGVSSAKGKATISTAGYIPTGNNESSAHTVNITPTVSNGTARYITKATSSITNGTATVTGGTASTSVTGMVTTSTNTGYSVSASATGGNASVTASSATVGVGYNPSSVTASTTADSATGASASQTKYIQKGALSASVSSNSGGSASMAATGFTPLSSGTSSYYVTLSTSAGSVKAKASVGTEGYVKSETNETSATSVSVSGNGTKLYIPAGSATQNAPTIDSSTGLITATSTVTEGYVAAATPSNTLQLTTKAATTYNASTSAQTIAAGTYLTGKQTIRAITTAGIDAANIKNGVTVTVGDSGSATRIKNVAGTFTKASTVSSGQTAAAAAQIRSGYSAWVDGAEVKGSLPNTSVTEGTTTVSSDTATRGEWSQTAGYTAARTIGAATFANEATDGTTYVDISGTTSAPVLVAGDYLYINKGWTDDLKISLSKLVPDGSDVKGHGEYIISGHSAYDNDGTLVAGTIPTLAASNVTVSGRTVTIPVGYYTGASGATAVTKSIGLGTVTSGTASITSLTKTYNSTNGNFDVTGSADVSAPTVGTAGYVSSSAGTKNAKTGGATVTTTLAKIAGSVAISGTKMYTPSISKQDVPSGVTQAASGAATTTAPSSGVYVAVKSAKNSGNVTAAATVSTEGYGTASYHGISGSGNVEVGANASATTYIPITTTSATVSGKTVSYGSGWITAGSKSVADGAYSADSSASTNSTVTPSVGLDSAATTSYGFTTTKPSGTTGTNFLTIDPGASATAWSVTPRANITTAGYLATGNKTGTAVSQTPSIDAGTNYYVPIRTVSFGGGGLSTSSDTNTVTAPVVTIESSGTFKDSTSYGVTTTQPSGTDGTNYLTIDGTGTGTDGSAVSSWGVSRAKATYTNSAGAIAAHSGTQAIAAGSTSGGKTTAITPTITDNFAPLYIPIVSNSFSGGGISITTNYSKSDLAVTLADGSDKNVSNYTVGAKDTTNYPYYIKVSGSTPAVSGKTKATRAAATYTNSAGAIAAHSGTSIWSASAVEPTVSVNAASGATYVSLKSAAIAGSSTNATATTTVAPGTVSISKQSTPSGVTNAASGAATTTAPSSGVYVAVKATAAANSTGTTSSISGSGTATVSTAGYAPTTLTGSVTVSGTATAKTSAKDSSMTYVPITTATPAFTGGGLSGTATASSSTASISDSTNNSGVSIATACTATRANVTYNGAVAGWVSKSSGTVALSSGTGAMTSKTYYINGVTMATPSSGSRTFTVTAPSGGTNHTYTFTQGADGRTTIAVDSTLTMVWNATDEALDFIYT